LLLDLSLRSRNEGNDGYQGFLVEELYDMLSNGDEKGNKSRGNNTGATAIPTQQRPTASQQVGQSVPQRKCLSGKQYQSFHE